MKLEQNQMIEESLFSYSTPPFFYLFNVGKSCPNALCTYLQLWKDKDYENCVFVSKAHISDDYGIGKNKFRQDLCRLFNEGLLSIEERNTSYKIELTSWEAMVNESV